MKETAIRYAKPVMSRKEFIAASGYSAAFIDRAIHSEYAPVFTERTSDAKNAKVMIITDEFEYLRRQGAFR